MLTQSIFDQDFFQVPCFRLKAPIVKSDFEELGPLGRTSPGFVDAKIDASNLKLSRNLMEHGFRKVSTQVQLRHDLSAVPTAPSRAAISDSLRLPDDLIIAHAEHFEASRYHQDLLVPRRVADALYAQWIRNSLSGAKCVIHIGSNFVTYWDDDGIRSIDLLSVLDKRKGIARQLLAALLQDARSERCDCVRVTTEVENAGALAAYRSVGFDVVGYVSAFHRYRAA